ncbi:MAG: hypothetical protein Q8O64_09225 [Sideroxyarcus sp.]|nr:hypothetical protein [Sideroxyarcus sp.]
MIEVIPNWHPAFVHFPIAFATAAVAFVAVGTVCRNWSYAVQCLLTGRWMLWADESGTAHIKAGIAMRRARLHTRI